MQEVLGYPVPRIPYILMCTPVDTQEVEEDQKFMVILGDLEFEKCEASLNCNNTLSQNQCVRLN